MTYQVTAADSSMQSYTVTITIAPSSSKTITAFSFLSVNNYTDAGLSVDVTATINGTLIAAAMPFGTPVTALKATFSTTGASVAVGSTTQVSGVTANDFSGPVIYQVTAADGSTQSYTVTVTIAPSSSKTITAFSFLSVNNSGLSADVTATIDGVSITATVPFGTAVTALKATFSTTGTIVAVRSTPQVSGVTANDFSSPVIYQVTAADSSTQSYTVSVTIAPYPITSEIYLYPFSFLSTNNPGLPVDVGASIYGTSIKAIVPHGTNVTALKATFSTYTETEPSTEIAVAVGGTPQVSGVTANDFSSPIIYEVTAADGSTQSYTVTVTMPPSCDSLALPSPGPGISASFNLGIGSPVSCLVGTTDGTGEYVALGTIWGLAGYALLPMAGGEAVGTGFWAGFVGDPVQVAIAPQPSGFQTFNMDVDDWPEPLEVYDALGNLVKSGGTLGRVAWIAGAPSGGSALFTEEGFGTAQPIYRIETVDAQGNWTAAAVLDRYLDTLVVANSGDILALSGTQARWYDPAATPLTEWFDVPISGQSYQTPELSRLADGSVALSIDGAWVVAFPDAQATTLPAPEWLRSRPGTQVYVVRNSTAQAIVYPNSVCASIEVVPSREDTCGTVKFPGVQCPALGVGRDGTVIALEIINTPQAYGCSWTWWPALLR